MAFEARCPLQDVSCRYESFVLLPFTLTVFAVLLIFTLKSVSEIDRPSCDCRSSGIAKRTRNPYGPDDFATTPGTTRLVIATGAPACELRTRNRALPFGPLTALTFRSSFTEADAGLPGEPAS